MNSTEYKGNVLTFDIEGQAVRCFRTGGDRLWRRECEYFRKTLTKYGNRFCPHIAVAMGRGLEEGVIDFGGADV